MQIAIILVTLAILWKRDCESTIPITKAIQVNSMIKIAHIEEFENKMLAYAREIAKNLKTGKESKTHS